MTELETVLASGLIGVGITAGVNMLLMLEEELTYRFSKDPKKQTMFRNTIQIVRERKDPQEQFWFTDMNGKKQKLTWDDHLLSIFVGNGFIAFLLSVGVYVFLLITRETAT